MAVSYNGWTASENPGEIGIVQLIVGGVSFPNGVRGGDIYTIFQWLATEIDRDVEQLHDGWCWGWEYRLNRNAANLSCHSSGTAIDINAPLHGNGGTDTWSPAQVGKLREKLAFLEGVITAGMDFNGTKDPMHFEISTDGATEADLARVASKIRNSQPAKEWPQMAMTDDDKKWIVAALLHTEQATAKRDADHDDARLGQVEGRVNKRLDAIAAAVAAADANDAPPAVK